MVRPTRRNNLNHEARSHLLVTFLCFPAVFLASSAWPSGINTDVAMTPNKDGGIYRLRLTYAEGAGNASVSDRDTAVLSSTLSYGLRSDWALFLNVPYVHRKTVLSGGARDTDNGFGDFTLLTKYRFFQRDTSPVDTYRWAWIAGMNARSGDSDFSSDSYDPLGGLVMSMQRGRSHVDADVLYQINTGGGPFRHDSLHYDVAHSYRVYPDRFTPGRAYSIETVAELNGHYATDGSNVLFVSPGIQLHLEGWTFETSLQVPVFQDAGRNGIETDYRLLVGFRMHF